MPVVDATPLKSFGRVMDEMVRITGVRNAELSPTIS
jgi:hypothetical protein